mmetsp:Transcript_28671/g.101547  ORF Transcript_28671/g.101547 Transcript_28671/m.101547 type:complete len:240 (+) Transcript_28671:431-1150(+)
MAFRATLRCSAPRGRRTWRSPGSAVTSGPRSSPCWARVRRGLRPICGRPCAPRIRPRGCRPLTSRSGRSARHVATDSTVRAATRDAAVAHGHYAYQQARRLAQGPHLPLRAEGHARGSRAGRGWLARGHALQPHPALHGGEARRGARGALWQRGRLRPMLSTRTLTAGCATRLSLHNGRRVGPSTSPLSTAMTVRRGRTTRPRMRAASTGTSPARSTRGPFGESPSTRSSWGWASRSRP